MTAMRQLRGTGALLAIALFALPRAAEAQAMPPPNDEAIDVQLFSYSIGPKQFFTVDSADIADQKQMAMDAMFTLLTNPFTIYKTTNDSSPEIVSERDEVVKTMAQAQLTAAYGVTDKIQIGAMLPLVFSASG